jgi:hypothetical protein
MRLGAFVLGLVVLLTVVVSPAGATNTSCEYYIVNNLAPVGAINQWCHTGSTYVYTNN